MTVEELREKLKWAPDDMEVKLYDNEEGIYVPLETVSRKSSNNQWFDPPVFVGLSRFKE